MFSIFLGKGVPKEGKKRWKREDRRNFENSKVNPESGVPLSCLPAYFEAYDAYAQRVDNEVTIVIIIVIRIMRKM